MKKEVINSPIRWAGSKKKILNEMLTFFDKKSEIYIEPFLGSGVVLINLINNIEVFNFKKIIVNDINSNIINFYVLLRDDLNFVEKNIIRLSEKYNALDNIKEKELLYYETREKYNKLDDKNKEKTMLFYFLMKTGYNGVYRENKKGMFNVPFGKKEKISCDISNLKYISCKLKDVIFYNCEYETFFETLNKKQLLNDAFVYFDPPYIPEEKAVIKKQELYTNEVFNHEEFVKNIKKYDIKKCLISMSESKQADLIYKEFKKYTVNDIVRTINPRKLIKSTEILYSNYTIRKKRKTK